LRVRISSNVRNLLKGRELAHRGGFEPPTFRLTAEQPI
jgi:hypothetical protein